MKDTDDLNYYEILGVSVKADTGEIEEAYQVAMATYGEDSIAGYSVISEEERMKMLSRVEEAYSVLHDNEQRELYDQKTFESSEEVTPEEVTPEEVTPEEAAQGEPAPEKEEDPSLTTPPEKSEEPGEPVEPPSKEPQAAPIRVSADLPLEKEKPPQPPKKKGFFSFLWKSKMEEEPPPEEPTEEKAEEDEEKILYDGSYLKSIREIRGIPLDEAAKETRISQSYLQAIEEDNFKALPEEVFVRGFIRSYASLLGLNAEEVVKNYRSLSS